MTTERSLWAGPRREEVAELELALGEDLELEPSGFGSALAPPGSGAGGAGGGFSGGGGGGGEGGGAW